MIYLDLLQFIGEGITVVLVNKTERGNTAVLFPVLLFGCVAYKAHLEYRKRKWATLTPREQVLRQQAANKTDRRDEPYPY